MSDAKPSITSHYGIFRRWLREQKFSDEECTVLSRVWRMRDVAGPTGRLNPMLAQAARIILDIRRKEVNDKAILGLRKEVETLRERESGKIRSLNHDLMANRLEKLIDQITLYDEIINHLFLPAGDIV